MNPAIFVGHAVTATGRASDIADVVSGLRRALTDLGWHVRPAAAVDGSVAADRVRAGQGRRLVQDNLDHVATSALLLLLADFAADASSLWIEAGVALASSVPIVVIARDGTALPFLLFSALGDDSARLPACHRITADLFTGIVDERHAIFQDVALDLTSWAKAVGIRA